MEKGTCYKLRLVQMLREWREKCLSLRTGGGRQCEEERIACKKPTGVKNQAVFGTLSSSVQLK